MVHPPPAASVTGMLTGLRRFEPISWRMRWAISGGAGFLGLHLARRLLDDGDVVRTLDVAPLDDPELEASVEELRGDIRDPAPARASSAGADVLVHAAAALPILGSGRGDPLGQRRRGRRRCWRRRSRPACAARS